MSNKSTHFRIRDADADKDAAEILSIYTPFVTHSITSLEFEAPTEAEIRQRISTTQQNFAWLICEADDENGSSGSKIAGYAYCSRHGVREGYQWLAEMTVYVSESFRGQGVGSILYNKLFAILTQQGYFQAVALISGDNPASTAFHKRHGFQLVGTWKNCGNKFGKWCNVSWYAKQLKPNIENPQKPVPYPQIKHLVSLQLDV